MKDSDKERELLDAGWKHDDGSWTAVPGTAPAGPWSTERAFHFLVLGNTCRALAALGWDVPREYVGGNTTTLGDYVHHPAKASRYVTIQHALKIEHLRADQLGRLVAVS